jgi:TRAP-type uncharacterized transport system substrate-binding protein
VIEPFTRQFFNQIVPTHFIGIDQSQMFGNEFEFIETLAGLLPFHLDKLLIENSMDRYQYLNDGKIQLVMSRSNEIYNLIHKTTPTFSKYNLDNIRFVCTLYGSTINILTTAMGIGDFADLKGTGLTVNVGPKDSCEYFIAMDLILEYQMTLGKDIVLTYYDTREILDHYGKDVQVAILTRSHPDRTILNLTNLKLSRIIDLSRVNNGNLYHMTLDEEPFYKEYPYYYKEIIMKEKLADYYPNLVLNWDSFKHGVWDYDSYRSRFVNTINVRYYLLSNTKTSTDTILRLLYNMKLNMNQLNKHEFVNEALNTASLNDFTMSLEVHKGAYDFYNRTGLYTQIDNPSCVLINGKCDERQLREHHLDNKLGPTFDQLFNQPDTRPIPKVPANFAIQPWERGAMSY